MSVLRDIIRHIVTRSPNSDELSRTRLTKLVYLVDWLFTQENHQQLTKVRWYFDQFGPTTEDVATEISRDTRLRIERTRTRYGSERDVIRATTDDLDTPSLNGRACSTIDAVIAATATMGWNELLNYVYATTPVRVAQRFAGIDLVKIADLAQDAVPVTSGR